MHVINSRNYLFSGAGPEKIFASSVASALIITTASLATASARITKASDAMFTVREI